MHSHNKGFNGYSSTRNGRILRLDVGFLVCWWFLIFLLWFQIPRGFQKTDFLLKENGKQPIRITCFYRGFYCYGSYFMTYLHSDIYVHIDNKLSHQLWVIWDRTVLIIYVSIISSSGLTMEKGANVILQILVETGFLICMEMIVSASAPYGILYWVKFTRYSTNRLDYASRASIFFVVC